MRQAKVMPAHRGRMAALLTGLILALVAPTASAASLTCGDARINTGGAMTEVHEACGEPKGRIELVNIEGAIVGWREVYDDGYGKADRSLRYRHGRDTCLTV